MRYRILASFQGAPYEAGVGPDESDVVLFAACPPPEALKFEPATGHWRKRVKRDEVQALYESRPVGMFRGERCVVLDDLSDRLHIVYLGHDALRAAQLGYWEIDRGVFELITPRHEVTDIVEQRLPLESRSDSGQHTWPVPMPPERPSDYGGATQNGLAEGGAGSPSHGYGSGGVDEFATGPQFLNRRVRLDRLPASVSQELPRAALGRSDPIVGRPADESEVAIPPIPEAPLPLEAEALRAASSAARRGQKSSQPKSAQEARAPRRPQPAVEPKVQAGPPEQAGPPQAAASVQAEAAEVSQPLAAPGPAAAMLSKAAMLSHAAAAAARRAGISRHQPDPATSATAGSGSATAGPGRPSPPSEHESQPPATLLADAAVATGEAAEASPVPAPDHAPPPSGPDRPTSPELAGLVSAMPAEPTRALSADAAPAAPGQVSPDYADATAAPFGGISDPPTVAHPPAASAVPSWTPQPPVQPLPGVGVAQPAEPMHATAANDAGFYAPYLATESMPRNGTADANATAASQVSGPPGQVEADPRATTRRRRGTKRRLPTQKIFSDLATQAAIPAAAYAIGEEVDGAMCLVRTDEGFEVFNAAAGARHEVRTFQDEESAYFYLFGVLVADSVRTGALAPRN